MNSFARRWPLVRALTSVARGTTLPVDVSRRRMMLTFCAMFAMQTITIRMSVAANIGASDSGDLFRHAAIMSLASLAASGTIVKQRSQGSVPSNDAIVIPTPGSVPFVWTAVAIGTNGQAVIAATSSGSLMVASCSKTPCQRDSLTTTSRAMPSFDMAALAIGADGLAVMAGRSNENVLLVHCENKTCSESASATVAAGRAEALAIGSDGFPVITFSVFDARTLKQRLHVAKCHDVACKSAPASIVLGPVNNLGFWNSSIAIGRDGRPMIAFVGPSRPNGSDASLFFAHCTDPACNAVNEHELVVRADGAALTAEPIPAADSRESNPDPGISSVMVRAGASGLPVIGYIGTTHGYVLRIMRCADSDCAGNVEAHAVASIDNHRVGMELDKENRPVFAALFHEGEGIYETKPSPDSDPPPFPDHTTVMALLRCSTPACPQSEKIRLGSIGIGQGGDSQLTLRPDGTVVAIAFNPRRAALFVWDTPLAH